MFPRVRAVGVGLVAVLACAACGAPQTAEVGDPVGGHLVRVELARRACLGIRPFLSNRALPADWPEGYEADVKAGVLRGPAGHVVAQLGQAIASVGIRSRQVTACSASGYVFALQDYVRRARPQHVR